MISTYSPSAFDQPQILIISVDGGLRIELARQIARLKALALVVLDLSVPEAALSRDVALAIVDDRVPHSNGLGIARALRACDPDLPVVLLREQAGGAPASPDNLLVQRVVDLPELLPGLLAERDQSALSARR